MASRNISMPSMPSEGTPLAGMPNKNEAGRESIQEISVLYDINGYEFDQDKDQDPSKIPITEWPNQPLPPPTAELNRAMVKQHYRRMRFKTTKLESRSDPFDFVIPSTCTPLTDEITQRLSNKIPGIENKYWMPLASRLKGWSRDVRRREDLRTDKFYLHHTTGMRPLRTFKDVKRYIFCGFIPPETAFVEDGKVWRLREWVEEQPDPIPLGNQMAKTASFLLAAHHNMMKMPYAGQEEALTGAQPIDNNN